jgi:hypothetical protein
MAKKRRRVGTITLGIKYTVDLDKPGMVKRAKDCFYEDINELVLRSSAAEFDAALIVTPKPKLTEADIDPYLLEDEDA